MSPFIRITTLGLALGLLASVSLAQCYPPGPRQRTPPGGGAGGNAPGSNQGGGGGRPLVGSPAQPGAPSDPGTPGPSTGAPSGPSTGGQRGPTGPSTPGAGGTAPSTGGPSTGGGGGTPMVFERGETSLDRLTIDWDYVVPKAGVQAMGWKQAIRTVRGDDKRPLLIVRECRYCKGTDLALLNRKLNNEKTSLMTRWFHCVKLPSEVSEASHPFHGLFPGHVKPHLVIVGHDGAKPVAFSGHQTQSELWSGMFGVLNKSYSGDAKRAISRVAKYLDVYDKLDAQEQGLLVSYDLALENKGRKHARTKKVEKRLEALRKKIAAVEVAEQHASDLGLIKKKQKTDEH